MLTRLTFDLALGFQPFCPAKPAYCRLLFSIFLHKLHNTLGLQPKLLI